MVRGKTRINGKTRVLVELRKPGRGNKHHGHEMVEGWTGKETGSGKLDQGETGTPSRDPEACQEEHSPGDFPAMKGSNEAVSSGQDRVYFLKHVRPHNHQGVQVPSAAAWIREPGRLFSQRGTAGSKKARGEARINGKTRVLVELRKPGRGNKHRGYEMVEGKGQE